ncbi:PAS domain S-box protein [bacterium]|nr:PAS domain S-box protein [candidate division CSSED10-310 bacterium]
MWIIFLPAVCALIFYLIGHYSSTAQEPVQSPAGIDAAVRRNWIRHTEYYTGMAKTCLSAVIGRDISETASIDRLDVFFSDMERAAQREGLFPASGMRILNPDGSSLAWAGTGYELPQNILEEPEIGESSGWTAVDLPAGTEILFWALEPGGTACVINLPITGQSLPPYAKKQPDYVSYIEALVPVRAGISGGPGDGGPEPSIHLDQSARLQLVLYPAPGLTTSISGGWKTAAGLAGYAAFVLILVFLVKRIPRNLSGWKLAAGMASACAAFVVWVRIDPDGRFLPEMLKDPKVYAGSSLYFALPGHLLIATVIFWLGTQACSWTGLSRRTVRLFRVISPFILFLPPYLASFILDQIIQNSSLEWWPRLFIPEHPAALALPAAALLATASAVRLTIWVWGWTGYFGGRIRANRRVVPAAWVFPAAICILIPIITPRSHKASMTAVQENMSDWLEDRDQLRKFALETNLVHLSRDPELRENLIAGRVQEHFTANELWNRSDLSAVSSVYGIELWDPDGYLLDRFAPGLDFDPPPPQFLDRLREIPELPLLMPWSTRRSQFQKDLTGGITILSGDDIIAYLIIRLPAGPLAAVPPAPEWGHQARLHLAWGGDTSQLPQGFPPLPDPSILGNPPEAPVWIQDRDNRRQLFMMRYREMERDRIPLLFAELPLPGLTRECAGYMRLGFIGILLVTPRMMFWTIRRIRKLDGDPGLTFTFRNQLMLTFTVFAVIIPMAFAFILRELMSDLSADRQRELIQSVSGKAMDSFRRNCIETAESQLPVIQATERETDDRGIGWMILDSQGHMLDSGGSPLQSPLPLEMITDVFLTNLPGCSFFPVAEGNLYFQAVLPCPAGTDAKSSAGTIILEQPIDPGLIQDIAGIPDIPVDIYARGRISSSSRPELFNTGFLPFWLEPDIHQIMQSTAPPVLIRLNPENDSYISYSPLRDSRGVTAGVLSIQFQSVIDGDFKEGTYDLIWLITAAFLAAGLGIAAIMGHRLASPVRELTAGAARVSRGELGTPVRVSAAGELRKFSDTFNRMMTDLAVQRRDLEVRHRFISTLIESMSAGLIATGSSGIITTSNSAFSRLFNMDRKVPHGGNLKDLLASLHLDTVNEAVRNHLQRSGPTEITTRFMTEGRIVHLRVSFAEIQGDEPGRPGLLLMFDDISDAVRSSKIEAYAEMARRVAHEIKNPLTPIQLSIEHLKQTFYDRAENFESTFEQCTNTILEEVRSLRTIATEFSRFARLPRPVRRPVDMSDLIGDVLSIFSSQPESIEIRRSIPSGLPMCFCDREQIKRVLINIIQNGIQAMPGGGILTVTAAFRNGRISVDIEDTGTGMDRDTMLRLFEPYFSTRQDGIGLGLVIAKAAVDEHDGEIRVQSVPGSGSNFTVILPVADPGDTPPSLKDDLEKTENMS